MRVYVLYYFMSTDDFQIGAPAVAGIGAPLVLVPSRRTRLGTIGVEPSALSGEMLNKLSET